MSKSEADKIDWSLTTWEGSLREQLRRWAELPLESIVRAQEEMQDLTDKLALAAKSRHAPESEAGR